MIPTSFDYVRAGSVKEALSLLAAGDTTLALRADSIAKAVEANMDR